MELLQTIFGEEALTYQQLQDKLKGAGKDGQDVKLADLSQGEYVSKNKYNTLETELISTKSQLEETNKQLEGYDPTWKEQAEQAQKDAQQEIEKLRFNYALDEKLKEAKAKNTTSVRALLNIEQLKSDGETIVGLTEQLEKIKAENDYLFENETPPPTFVAPVNNQGAQSTSWRDKINENYTKTKGE